MWVLFCGIEQSHIQQLEICWDISGWQTGAVLAKLDMVKETKDILFFVLV